MSHKFLYGDVVRQKGDQADSYIAHIAEDGDHYLLSRNPIAISPQRWASEKELQLVKRTVN
ncbi:MAG TPA: hypothetical protein VMB49_02125 [Acidobacteriaceae bacterium]|nr:hypothetical protein [Acidobacteriaceae bacterium]